jgi:hypothetical protein
MAFDPNDKDMARARTVTAAITSVLTAAIWPGPAWAALQGAAGGKTAGGGGFDRFVQFINHLADYAIPIGGAFSVLGLIWGGLLFQAGDTRAGRVLGFVALGVGIVLLSKPIAA